jgi:hypothetical protein
VAGAFKKHIRVDARVVERIFAGVEGGGGAEFGGQLQAGGVDVGDGDVGGTEGEGCLQADEADGSGPGDQDP